jgi:hypothetical protein
MGVIVMGCKSPVRDWNFQMSVYQMMDLERQVLDEGNCGRVTDRGEEACEDVRKRQVCMSPPGHLLIKAARLRTETSYKAGSTRRASTTLRSRPQSVAQVNGELAQRSITLLSGEVCIAWPRPSVAPTSRACPNHRKAAVQVAAGGAEFSRGHSTALPRPTGTGRTER